MVFPFEVCGRPMNAGRAKLKKTDLAIITLTVITATIHFYRASVNPKVTVLFTLNGLGFIILVAMLYLPYLSSQVHPRLILRILMGYTALTFLLYFAWSIVSSDWVLPYGPIVKLIEALLFILLWRDERALNAGI